jgi:hypothetical protein
MQDTHPLVPPGISHDHDLSKLTHPERMRHHTKGLRSAMFQSARNAAADYMLEHPEAAELRTLIETTAYQPKPPTYYPAWRKLIGLWLTDDAALVRPQGQDVDYLNTECGAVRFDRSRFLSKAITGLERKHADAVFAAKGLVLPETVRKRADVKRAAKVGKANARPDAKPFGNVGTITGNTLTIDGQSFTIQPGKGRSFIRISIGGKQRRLYLDEVEWVASLLTRAVREAAGKPLPSCIYTVGELATCRVSASFDPLEDYPEEKSPGELATSSVNDSGELATCAGEAPSLSDRIAKLAAARAQAPAATPPPGVDPLEIDPLEL